MGRDLSNQVEVLLNDSLLPINNKQPCEGKNKHTELNLQGRFHPPPQEGRGRKSNSYYVDSSLSGHRNIWPRRDIKRGGGGRTLVSVGIFLSTKLF